MLAMTFELNKNHFDGKSIVACSTCHRGAPQPASKLSFERIQPTDIPPMQPANKPSVAQILAKHIEAIGGRQKLEAMQNRHIVARRIEPNGQSEPEELWQTANGLSKMLTLYGKTAVVEAFDGHTVWKRFNNNSIELRTDEAQQIRSEAAIAFGLGIDSHFANLAYDQLVRLDGNDTYAISATGTDVPGRLYFDVESGLLVRRVSSVATVLGDFDYRVDYRDYREFDGVRLPTKLRFEVPNIRWEREVLKVETNLHIDDSIFKQP
jgi:zinc protease